MKNTVYKKWTICSTLEQTLSDISIITDNMVRDGIINLGDVYAEAIPVTGLIGLDEEVKHITDQYCFITPAEKYMAGTSSDNQKDESPNRTKIEYFKIYEYMNDDNKGTFKNWTNPPHSLDYTIGLDRKLQAEYAFDVLGNVIQVTHYLNAVPGPMGLIYSDPIVQYNATYYYDDDGYVTHRDITRDWMLTDNTWSGIIKSTTKYYTRIQARNVGKRRRQSLIDNLIIGIGFFILVTEGFSTVSEAEELAMPFFDDVSDALSKYYESGNKKNSSTNTFALYNAVLINSATWLDNVIPVQYAAIEGLTIRSYILIKIDVNGGL